jgi:hypothetical protein
MASKLSANLSYEKGRPISMVTYDMKSGKFIINPEAESVIKILPSPLGVISVAGMYRTGKSYLLNRVLLNQSNGFTVGPSINPCTKGLWMWSKTIQAHTPQGKPINLLIIDTEGIGATDEDHNHDNKIMTLAILLSSYFLYNSIGTIDENSIQSLSLIVNITKNIQKKNNNNDFTKYLPTFMWVIRDFSLQLKNREGQPITSKEYLEYSLEFQQGNSEVIKNKNEIRKMVKEYFPKRDCVTLVRPLLEEDNLQSLEKMDVTKLRKEFIEQVNYLRKVVLNSINPKKLNGQELSGEMFINLLNSYVNMINEGAVPIIQTAWTYIRQNQALLAKKRCLEDYSKKLKELENKFPMKEEYLKSILKKIKLDVTFIFREGIIGDPEEKDIKELKTEMKKMKNEIIKKNIDITKIITEKFMEENYKNMKAKLVNNQYEDILDYKDDIEQFVEFCLNKCPQGPGRDNIIYEYLILQIIDNADILYNNNISEKEKILEENDVNIMELKKEFDEMFRKKEIMNNNLMEINNKIEKINLEKENMNIQNSNESENLNKLIEEKNKEIQNLKNKLTLTEKNCQNKIIEMKKKVDIAEKLSQESDLESTQINSNYEKEKVLMKQKIIFLEKTLKELESNNNNKKNLKTSRTYSTISSEEATSIKQKKEKLENEIKRLNKEIKNLQEKNIELDSQILTKGKKIDNEKLGISEIIETYQKKLEEIHDSNSDLAKDINKMKEEAAKQIELISEEYEAQIEEILSEQKNWEENEKNKEEIKRKELAKLQAEFNVLSQDKELIDKKINKMKDTTENEKMEHDKYIKILEENNKELMDKYENINKENEDIKNINKNELIEVKEINNKKENEISEINNKLKNDLNRIITENENKVKELRNKVKNNQNNIIPKMKQKISDLQNEKENLSQDLEFSGKTQKHKLAELALEYEDLKEKILTNNRQQLEEDNNENDQQIQEIRKIYQIEKDKINEEMKRINEEAEKKINLIEKEQNDKLNLIEKEKDDKIAELQDILEELNLTHDDYIKKTEKEILLRNQKIENLQKFINDTKNSINIIKSQQEKYLQEMEEEFENEKNEMNERIKSLKKDEEITEIEINKIKEQNEIMKGNIKELKDLYEDIDLNLKNSNQEYDEEINKLKNNLNEIINNINMNNSNYDKDLLLKSQKLEFLNNKLSEIKNEIDKYKEIFEEKIENTKNKITEEYNDKIINMKKNKEDLETQLNKVEDDYNNLNQKLETESENLIKEKENVTEKLNDLTIKKRQLGDELDSQHSTDQTILLKLRSEYKLKNDNLSKDNSLLREKLQKLEQNYNKLTTNYDIEKSTWDNKFLFINQQKESLEKDLEEIKSKYEQKMDNIQKKILEERERLEQIYKKSLQEGEQIHNTQINQAQETFNKKYEEVNVQNNNLIKENALLTKKIEDYENNRNSLINDIDKKLKDVSEQEKKLRNQYDNIKKEKAGKIEQLKYQIENEKKKNKVKLEELENKLNEYDGKQNNINTNYIKEKAVNEKNKENKLIYIQQLNETLEKLKKENEKLILENKEVQRENDNYRKSSRGSSRNSSNIGTNYIPRRRPKNIAINLNKENLAVNYMNQLTGRNANNSSNNIIIPDNRTDTKGILTSLMDDKSVISMNNNINNDNNFNIENNE